MKRSFKSITFSLVLSLLSLLVVIDFTITESFAETDKIVFTSNRDGYNEIYTMNADGSGVVRLTNNSAHDSDPDWSPDGTKIVFLSKRDGNTEIYTMNADGTGQTRITDNPSFEDHASWSHDGKKIVFTSNSSSNYEIYTMNADGTGQTRITDNPSGDYAPNWSHDGKKIVFKSHRDGNPEIYTMNADGTGEPVNLTNNPGEDSDPAWSHDGKKISFTSNRNGNWEVYTMNADGTEEPVNLTNNPSIEYYTNWSHDDSKIAFTSYRDENWEVYTMNADGSEQTNLTKNSSGESSPSWSPSTICKSGTLSKEGKCLEPFTATNKISFVSERDGNYEIYIMNADGSGLVNLTKNPTVDHHPNWSHDGSKIAFQSDRDGNHEVYTMNADGTGLNRLTESSYYDGDTVLSHDGTKISFRSEINGNSEVYTMNADGSEVSKLTNSPRIDSPYAWSSDGSKIVFASEREKGNREIYVMNADGTEVVNLTNHPSYDWYPDLSSDGSKIVFASEREGKNSDIYVMNADGTEVVNLTNHPDDDLAPSWSHDGSKIAFTRDIGDNREIYVMNADGTGLSRLTNSPGYDGDPSWSPDGNPLCIESIGTFVVNVDGSVNPTQLRIRGEIDDREVKHNEELKFSIRDFNGNEIFNLIDSKVSVNSFGELGGMINLKSSLDSGMYTIAGTYDGKCIGSTEFTIPNKPLSSPTNLQATAISSSQIDLSWDAPKENRGSVTSYKIEVMVDSESPSFFIVESNKFNQNTKYSHTDLNPDTKYTYRIYAINDDAVTSDPSQSVSSSTLQISIATDPSGNNTPPELTMPDGLVQLKATTPEGAVYNFVVTAYDKEDGELKPNCTHKPGLFPIGTTPVECSATDKDDNKVEDGFTVMVEEYAPIPDNGFEPWIPVIVAIVTAIGSIAGAIAVKKRKQQKDNFTKDNWN